eukprot:1360085-Prymnesium_polylepis.2
MRRSSSPRRATSACGDMATSRRKTRPSLASASHPLRRRPRATRGRSEHGLSGLDAAQAGQHPRHGAERGHGCPFARVGRRAERHRSCRRGVHTDSSNRGNPHTHTCHLHIPAHTFHSHTTNGRHTHARTDAPHHTHAHTHTRTHTHTHPCAPLQPFADTTFDCVIGALATSPSSDQHFRP